MRLEKQHFEGVVQTIMIRGTLPHDSLVRHEQQAQCIYTWIPCVVRDVFPKKVSPPVLLASNSSIISCFLAFSIFMKQD
jgi:hypothetical protein